MATRIPNKIRGRENNILELSYLGKKGIPEILGQRKSDCFELTRNASSSNRMYCGDNLAGLHHLLKDFRIRGKVTLVYIDPPFATKGTFVSRKQRKAYDDDLSGTQYVENLRERLILLREIMAANGSIYLHLDENMVFHMKLVMDEIFGSNNYRNFIIRKKCNPKNYTRKSYGNIADFILFYTKSNRYVWNRPTEPLSEQNSREYQYIEPGTGRRFMKVPLHAPGERNGATGGSWRGRLPPPGKHWQYSPETLDEMDDRGEISWSTNGNPRRKVYLDRHPGIGIQDIWLNFKDAHNQNIKITGYPTEKNPALLRRIVEASSNPGDMVLDCYAGSGTTLNVANELGRQWIGMDDSVEAISTILGRFEHGLSRMGDYVRKPGDQQKNIPSQVSLFDSLSAKRPANTDRAPLARPRISDFLLFIQRDRKNEFYPVAKKWIQTETDTATRTHLDEPMISVGVNYAAICYELHSRDSKLAVLIDKLGTCSLKPRVASFDFLVDAILSQQLSKEAADAIISRLRSLFPNSCPTPETFVTMPRSTAIGAGISARKYRYISDLAQLLYEKRLDLMELSNEPDETVRIKLKDIRGIGDWTVDMYLLFGLGRLDIFPVHDLAIRKSMSTIYDVEPTDIDSLEKIANRWKPYRSVASWYFYRNINTNSSS